MYTCLIRKAKPDNRRQMKKADFCRLLDVLSIEEINRGFPQEIADSQLSADQMQPEIA